MIIQKDVPTKKERQNGGVGCDGKYKTIIDQNNKMIPFVIGSLAINLTSIHAWSHKLNLCYSKYAASTCCATLNPSNEAMYAADKGRRGARSNSERTRNGRANQMVKCFIHTST